MRALLISTMVMGLMVAATAAGAAPALDIRTLDMGGSVQGNMAGPSGIDPESKQGQWFIRRDAPDPEVRTHEFYDNALEHGGGAKATTAIHGRAVNILTPSGNMWTPGMPIGSFDILATITNDLPGEPTLAEEGDNSHQEFVADRKWIDHRMIMTEVKLTAEFAVDPHVGPPFSGAPNPPYNGGREKYIVAENHDQLGWYCFSDEAGLDPFGQFSVPTWDFADMGPGESAQRRMSFYVLDALADPSALLPGDPEYIAIQENEDLLLNRSTSLKISTWVDTLWMDTGMPYPSEPMRGSDCSVFFNPVEVPEPGMLVLLACMGFVLLAARRR